MGSLRIPFEEAISEPKLLKNRWDELTSPQQVALKTLYGLDLNAEERVIYSQQQGSATYDDLGYVKDVQVMPYKPKVYREAWVVAGRRSGKALDVTTPIPVPCGWTTMGKLQVGEEVFDERGQTCRVTFATPVMRRESYLITFSDGNQLIADEEHQWFIWSKAARKALAEPYRTARPEVKTTRQLLEKVRVGGESNWAIELAEPVQRTERALPIDPYLLGVWLGDGTAARAEVTTTDREILEAFREGGYVVTPRGPITFGINGHTKFNRTVSFCHKLNNLGVLRNKHIPALYLLGSVEQRIALLQGLMDTDGYVTKKGCEFYNTNRNLAEGVYELVQGLGCRATIRSKTAKLYGKEHGVVWTVEFQSRFPAFRLPRKLAKQRILKNKERFRYIVSIEPAGLREVRCIQVDSPSRLYLAGRGYIPTHNTDAIASTIVAYEAAYGGHEEYVRKGQEVRCFQIAQDIRMAMYSLHFIKATLESGIIGYKLIEKVIANQIRLKNGLTIYCLPPTLKAVRGYANPIAVLDEVGVWYQDSDSANPDYEIYRAVRPAQMQFPDAKLVGISSPWNKQGLLYTFYEAGTDGRHAKQSEKKTFRNVLVIHAPTASMAPSRLVTKDALEDERNRDAKAFEREVLAQFQDSISGFLSTSLLKEAISKDVIERPYNPAYIYVAALDPAFRHDAFAFTIFHMDETGRVVQDVVRRFLPPPGGTLNPDQVFQVIAPIIQTYQCGNVYTDQYQLESLQQLAIKYNILLEGVPFKATNKAAIYGSMQQLLNQKRLAILDMPEVYKELASLERKLTAQGVVQINAPQGQHDDIAAVCALACFKCLWLFPDPPRDEKKDKTAFDLCQEQIMRKKMLTQSQQSVYD